MFSNAFAVSFMFTSYFPELYIFSNCREYLKRMSLYRKPIWQCESTGKSNLTYKEALESEKVEKEKVQDKLPEQLQKRVLLHVQFRKYKCIRCFIYKRTDNSLNHRNCSLRSCSGGCLQTLFSPIRGRRNFELYMG